MKLVDFGFAKHLKDKKERVYTKCGTPGYLSPEVIQKGNVEGKKY